MADDDHDGRPRSGVLWLHWLGHRHNDRGEFRALVRVSDAVRPGVTAASKGYWPKRVTGAANANATVAERDSDMGGGAVFHDNRVEVTAAL